MTCRHLSYEREIVVLAGVHVDPCAGDWMPELEGSTCVGCWPCPIPAARHCNVCATHLDVDELGTCITCRGSTRRDLREILELAATLPDQALNAARDSHLAAAAEIPGDDALVMLARGSAGLHDDDPTELLPPSYVLAWWETTWAEARHEHQPSSDRAPWPLRPALVLAKAWIYLDARLDWAASNHPGFHAFAADLHRTRSQLEQLLHAGDQPAEGVPCFVCDTTLTRTYRDPIPCTCPPAPVLRHLVSHHVRNHDQPDLCCLGCAWTARHQLHDQGGDHAPVSEDPYAGWSCPRCQRDYSTGEYQLAVAVLHDQHARALPAVELADRLGLKPATIWQWAHRGHVRKHGRAADGRTLYDVADALRHAASRNTAGDQAEAVS